MAKVVYYVSETFGSTSARQLCATIAMANQGSKAKTVDLGYARQLYESMLQQAQQEGEVDLLSFDDILTSSKFEERLLATKTYLERLAATPADSATGHIFINGVHSPLHAVSYSRDLVS